MGTPDPFGGIHAAEVLVRDREDTSGSRRDAADRSLLSRVCQGDSAAHRALFDDYYARVYGFVLRRLKDPPLAEEVVADVFFELWRSADRFTGESRVSTWTARLFHFFGKRKVYTLVSVSPAAIRLSKARTASVNRTFSARNSSTRTRA